MRGAEQCLKTRRPHDVNTTCDSAMVLALGGSCGFIFADDLLAEVDRTLVIERAIGMNL